MPFLEGRPAVQGGVLWSPPATSPYNACTEARVAPRARASFGPCRLLAGMARRRVGRRTDTSRGKLWSKSYREFLEEKCRALLDQDPAFLAYPPPTLEVTYRLAERGQPCSLCGNPIPTDAEVDLKPQEYVFLQGS